ncbi:PDZ domain-containing protein [Baekduia soli]|uniref:PDZ domain-containing protein n=1 Tax=Baekduia soli TaxID=496014 RepID=A0A5B8U3A3_9ACTN|nr:trypsin-like peptidase domain-containing protein [Baekduia soli]QEC47539.1 PDZ domain-containing protein [Baekduia soli]
MPTTLRQPPDDRILWARRPGPPDGSGPPGGGGSGGGGDSGDGGGPRRRGRGVAALVAATALLGGGAGAGVVALSGGGRTTTATTTVVRSAAGESSGSAGGLDAHALYATAATGVVDITARGVSTAGDASASPFGRPPQPPTATATGTGFVVDVAGHIVTAEHVVDGASSITVRFADGTTRKATVLGTDNATDVAVLKVDAAGLTLHPLKLATSSVAIGESVAAIGDPFGYARSISTGIVSGVDRTIQAPNGFTVAHAVQTDAALNPGNSGGPLLDADGEVVGIVDQIATGSGADQSSGVGFAVPVAIVRSELAALERGEKVSHAYLGVATSDTSSVQGAPIGSVTSGGPAASAGLRAGDVVTRLGSTTISDSNDLVAAIAAHRPGEKVQLTVRRGSGTTTLTVTLGTQPTQSSSGG